MEIEEELLKIFNSFIFSNNCKLIKVKYDPTFFGNFLLEIQYGKFSFRIINDRDQLFIEKYDEIAAEWNDVGFPYVRIDINNLKDSLFYAFTYIENVSHPNGNDCRPCE
jgi:hypothetical protein